MTHGSLSEDPPLWIMYLVKINHLLLAINSAINILIYSFKVRLFYFFIVFGRGRAKECCIYLCRLHNSEIYFLEEGRVLVRT